MIGKRVRWEYRYMEPYKSGIIIDKIFTSVGMAGKTSITSYIVLEDDTNKIYVVDPCNLIEIIP